MLVLHHDPILALVSGFDLGDGEHDHVVVVTIRHHLVAATLLANSCALFYKILVYVDNGKITHLNLLS